MKKFCFFIFIFFSIIGTDRRPSYPYITGDGFRAYANHILDDSLTFEPKQIVEKDIIYVCTSHIEIFFSQYLPQINNQFILITHNRDKPITSEFNIYINNKKIIRWFAENVDGWTHPKLTSIPIGIENRYNPCGKLIDMISPFIEKKSQNKKRTINVYANFNTRTHPERANVYHKISNKSLILWAPRKNFVDYLEDLSNSIFVLSPRGNGIDCHRTWEALLMGAYPIVKTSSLDAMYKDLPVIILNDWDELTKELLEQKLKEFQTRTFKKEKCYFEYWKNLIEKSK